MSDKSADEVHKPRAEVMRPLGAATSVRLVEADSVGSRVSIFERAKNWVHVRELESQLKKRKAERAVMEELELGAQARERLERAIVRAGMLDKIRQTEELAVYRDLVQAAQDFEDAAERVKDREVRNAERDLRLAQLRMATKEATTEKPQPAPEPSKLEKIRSIQVESEGLKNEIISAMGGEDNLDEDSRDLLAKIELAKRDALARIFEE